jgi:hypothetical protein
VAIRGGGAHHNGGFTAARVQSGGAPVRYCSAGRGNRQGVRGGARRRCYAGGEVGGAGELPEAAGNAELTAAEAGDGDRLGYSGLAAAGGSRRTPSRWRTSAHEGVGSALLGAAAFDGASAQRRQQEQSEERRAEQRERERKEAKGVFPSSTVCGRNKASSGGARGRWRNRDIGGKPGGAATAVWARGIASPRARAGVEGLGPRGRARMKVNRERWPRAGLSRSWAAPCSGPARFLIQLLFHYFKYSNTFHIVKYEKALPRIHKILNFAQG